MRLAVIAALGVSSSAVAQPVTDPYHCEVTIVRAPDEVRTVIEDWLRREPRCTSTLELRVLPTEDGLYLMAVDDDGRIRERVVADAETVAALVMSWIADDSLASDDPDPPADTPDDGDGDGDGDEERAPAPARATKAATTPSGARGGAEQWLTLGGMLLAHATATTTAEGSGLRVELDLARSGRWSFSAAIAVAQSSIDSYHFLLDVRDARATAMVAHNLSHGRWQLRVAAGVGIIHTRAYGTQFAEEGEARVVYPLSELSMLLAARVGRSWAVTAGPVMTMYMQTLWFDFGDGYMRAEQRNVDLAVLAGLRRRM